MLRIMCADAWPGLLGECRPAMRALRRAYRRLPRTGRAAPRSRAARSTGRACFRSTGRARNTSARSSWPVAAEIVAEHPGDFARGPVSLRRLPGHQPGSRPLADGDRWYEYPRYCSSTSPRTSCGCAARRWTGSGWTGGSPSRTRSRWRGGRRWPGWTSSSGRSTDCGSKLDLRVEGVAGQQVGAAGAAGFGDGGVELVLGLGGGGLAGVVAHRAVTMTSATSSRSAGPKPGWSARGCRAGCRRCTRRRWGRAARSCGW